MRFDALPGGSVIERGLKDIDADALTDEALLVMIGSPRLRRAGLTVRCNDIVNPENVLYERLAASDSDSAHSRYNALIRLLVSFERALESGAR